MSKAMSIHGGKNPPPRQPACRGPGRGEIRPYIYAGLDLVLAAGWAVLLIQVIPHRHLGASLLLWSIAGSAATAALGMAVRTRWGWTVAALSLGFLLLVWAVVLVLLLASVSYLAGVYGAVGRAAAMVTLILAALATLCVALVPALQLKFLRTRAGRRAYGRS